MMYSFVTNILAMIRTGLLNGCIKKRSDFFFEFVFLFAIFVITSAVLL